MLGGLFFQCTSFVGISVFLHFAAGYGLGGVAYFLFLAALGHMALYDVRKAGIKVMQLINVCVCAYVYWPTMDGEPVYGYLWYIIGGWLALVLIFGMLGRRYGADEDAERDPSVRDPSVRDIRLYLNVSYDEKDHARALGAKWDPARRLWYVPAGTPTSPFEAWIK